MLKGEEEKAVNYLNTAVEENPEIYDKIRKEMIFQIIMRKIYKPTKEEKRKNKLNKLKNKEKQTMSHLENTYNLVGNLRHNDVKVVEVIREKRKEEKEKEIE